MVDRALRRRPQSVVLLLLEIRRLRADLAFLTPPAEIIGWAARLASAIMVSWSPALGGRWTTNQTAFLAQYVFPPAVDLVNSADPLGLLQDLDPYLRSRLPPGGQLHHPRLGHRPPRVAIRPSPPGHLLGRLLRRRSHQPHRPSHRRRHGCVCRDASSRQQRRCVASCT